MEFFKRNSSLRVSRTKSIFDIFSSNSRGAKIASSKKATLGMALLSLRSDIRPISKALPAELMVTLPLPTCNSNYV